MLLINQACQAAGPGVRQDSSGKATLQVRAEADCNADF